MNILQQIRKKPRPPRTPKRKTIFQKPGSFRPHEVSPEVIVAGSFGSPLNLDVYQPPVSSLVSPEGSWVMVKRPLPPMENDLHEHVTIGRVFWATHPENADEEGFSPDGKYLMNVTTPFGDLKLWPYEYTVFEPLRLLELWQAKELVFHAVGDQSMNLDDVLFYARSRGIALADALVMALGSIKGPIGWFEPAPELQEAVAALGRIGGPLTEVNHQRRAAARARRKAE